MVSRLALLALACCVALAGCPALPGGGSPSEGSTTPDPGEGSGSTGGGDGSTPWGTDELTVGITAPGYDNRSFESTVRTAVEFWNARTGSETPFDADLVVDPDATDPEIEIRYVPRVRECDGEAGTFYWCAPALSEEPDTYTLRVSGSLADAGLRNATTRAFAAALGTDPDQVAGVQSVDRPRFRDPWPGDPTVVSVDASATDREVRPLVASALDYWERVDDRYGNYTTEFALRPDATDPDVLVRFVPSVAECGHEGDDGFVGCAPVLSDRQLVENTTVVQVETGYTNESTQFALRHELGHVYGLEHGEGPDSLMTASTARLDRLAQPNVTERAFPWQSERLTVYVDRASLPGSNRTVDRQVSAALEYYRAGAGGAVPASLAIERVDDPGQADVVVRGAAMDAASNESLYGSDTDADPALEYYTDQTIYVDQDLDPATLGWHVGYWLGDGLTAATGPTELPPPFDDPTSDPRREWWQSDGEG